MSNDKNYKPAKEVVRDLLKDLKMDNDPAPSPQPPELPDSFFDGDKRTIATGIVHSLAYSDLAKRLDGLEKAIEDQKLLNCDLIAAIEQVQSQIAHLTWMTHDIDPIANSTGSDRYANNWLPKPNWLWKLLDRLGGK